MTKASATTIAFIFPWLLNCQEISITPIPIKADRFYTNIVAMAQDKNGFIWLADQFDGLKRYDGTTIKYYKSSPFNENSLFTDRLESIYAGEKYLWIGCFGQGLDRLDPETETFVHFHHDPDDPRSLRNNWVDAVLEDRDGTLWVGTISGLDTLDAQTGHFVHIRDETEDGGSLDSAMIRVLYEGQDGTIWIGAGHPFFKGGRKTPRGGLFKYEKDEGKITRYHHDPNDEQTLWDNRVRAIFEDSHGTFWVGTAGDGLHIMDREGETFQRCRNDPKEPWKLSRPPVNTSETIYADDHITFINEDLQGGIWIGTFAGGIHRFDPFDERVAFFGMDGVGNRDLGKNDFFSFLKTRDNLLWISGWEPKDNQVLYQISTIAAKLDYKPVGRRVTTFAQDAEGHLWIGTRRGLWREDANSAEHDFQTFVHKHTPSVILNNLTLDGRGNVWMATGQGLYFFDKANRNFRSFKWKRNDENSLTSNFVTSLVLSDTTDQVWIGTNSGLDLLHVPDSTFMHYRHNPSDSGSISSNIITRLVKDFRGDMWIGTDKGVNFYDAETGQFHRKLEGMASAVFSIFEDHHHRIWVSTYRAGLYIYDPQTNVFESFTDATGLITSELWIKNIAEDQARQIWLDSDIGLIRLNPESKSAILYGQSWKANAEHDTHVLFSSHEGELFLGDEEGYYQFEAADFQKDSTVVPRPYLLQVSVGNQRLTAGKDEALPRPLLQTERIELSYRQNTFTLEFSSIDFITPVAEKNLVYRLVNYDKDWRKSGAEKKVQYVNVSPGKYEFRLKAVNLYGNEGERSLVIVVLPPWWMTWWAYVGYGLALLALLFFVRHLELQRQKRKLAVEQEKLLHQQKVNTVTAKFVPNAFLQSLGKKDIMEVKLGDAVEEETTVMFSDIRDYTTLSENMTPQETFQFVNAFNRRMGPVIQENRGFVNQYLGDAIMALFKNSAKDGLIAAIQMQQTLTVYNQERMSERLQPIRLGIGLHTGPLIMGIIGDEQRMDAATISDTVNTASRIESLTKYFKTNILLSAESLARVHHSEGFKPSEQFAAFHTRFLGRVQLKGKKEPTDIYECFDGDLPEAFEQKANSQSRFAEGMDHYLTKEFAASVAAFEEVLVVSPEDLTARLFLEKAKGYLMKGVPEDWSGVEVLMFK